MKITRTSTAFFSPYNSKNNLCCKHLKSVKGFTNFITKNFQNLNTNQNSEAKNEIYSLDCTHTNRQYVSKSDSHFILYQITLDS